MYRTLRGLCKYVFKGLFMLSMLKADAAITYILQCTQKNDMLAIINFFMSTGST